MYYSFPLVGHLKLNKIFFSIVLLWIVVGAYLGPLYLVVIPFTVLLFLRGNYFLELLLGFWFILILSDSTLRIFEFAKILKPYFILLLAFGFWVKRKELSNLTNPLLKPFIPFILWAFCVVPFSPEFGICFQKTLSYALLLLLVPYFVNISLKENERNFYRGVVWFGVFSIIGGVLYGLLNSDAVFLEERFRGIFGNANALGIFSMLLFIFFELTLSKNKQAFSRSEKYFLYGVILIALVYSQTRSAIFSTLIYFLFSRIYFISGFLGFLLFCTILILNQEIVNIMVAAIDIFGLDSFFRKETLLEGSGRVIAWQFAWNEIQSSDSIFTFGKGFSYTESLFKDNFELLSRRGHLGNAHQSFLTFWLDTGLVGLLLYVVALIMTFVKAAKLNVLALPILFALLFSVSFESWLTASLNPFTIILIMILTVLLYQSGNSNQEKVEEHPVSA